MNAIHYDADLHDDVRREQLYDGRLFVYSPRPSTIALCDLAREMCESAFAPYDPREAQHHLSVEKYVEILAKLKPQFIHHPKCKEIIPAILEDRHCELDKTYFDVPRLRTVTSDGYLTSGLGYAFKPHRDTWYSPPMCQLNWWLPVYEITPENAMAFHPHYWDRPIQNSSREFNYQQWQQTGRKAAPKLVSSDTRRQSEALEPIELEPQLRLITQPGGMIVFSAAHLHSTVPNLSGVTRFSIDFRTVHLDDLIARHGAPNIDSACSGTTIHDYLRGSDRSNLPQTICEEFEGMTSESSLVAAAN
jgi:hypothetical protein